MSERNIRILMSDGEPLLDPNGDPYPPFVDEAGFDLEAFSAALKDDAQKRLADFLSTRSVASSPSLLDERGIEKHLIYKRDYDEFIAQEKAAANG